MTQQTFANFIGMAPGTLSSIFNDRTRPTINIVEAIKKKLPDVSTDWLMFGEGSMYNNKVSSSDQSDVPSQTVNNEPSLNFEQSASSLPENTMGGRVAHPESMSSRPYSMEMKNIMKLAAKK